MRLATSICKKHIDKNVLRTGASLGFFVRLVNYKVLKGKDYCPVEIIKGLTDKEQFQYLTKLMGPQEGTYLYATQFHSLR